MATKKERLLDNFLALSALPSPSRRERAVADKIKALCREYGYQAEEDDAAAALEGDCGNLRVRVPAKGQGPALLLAAHMDTVETGDRPLSARVEGDWIVGDGERIVGADDKTGVAALLEVLARIKEDKIRHGPLTVLFTIAEEIECRGAALVPDAWLEDLDAGIALDYSSPLDIVTAAPTKVALRLKVNGHGGHAGFPERTVNAAHVLARTVARLPQGRLDELSTANLGILRGGTAINVVPATAEAEYEIRSHNKEALDFHIKRALGIIEGAVREARVLPFAPGVGLAEAWDGDDAPLTAKAVKAATVDVDIEVGYEGYRLDADSAPVAILQRAILTASGAEARLVTAQGGSDANVFNRRGLPSAVLGCGMYGAHGARERANIPEMRLTVETLLQAVGES